MAAAAKKVVNLTRPPAHPSTSMFLYPVEADDGDDMTDIKTARTTVVRLKRSDGQIVQGCDVYIGRQLNMGGWRLTGSKWQNPYAVKDCKGGVKEAVQNFELYLHTRADLLSSIQSELRGKVLGCWCKNKPTDLCHGDVLARLADGDPSHVAALVAAASTAPAAPAIDHIPRSGAKDVAKKNSIMVSGSATARANFERHLAELRAKAVHT